MTVWKLLRSCGNVPPDGSEPLCRSTLHGSDTDQSLGYLSLMMTTYIIHSCLVHRAEILELSSFSLSHCGGVDLGSGGLA